MLGLFSPFRFELPEYLGYDIKALKDNVRFLEVCINRGGQAGGMIGLFFDGATCNFWELPSPGDTDNLKKVYSYVKNLRNAQRS